MPRLSIDLTDVQHKQIKATAALLGQSVKDYVLTQTLRNPNKTSDSGKEKALHALFEHLRPRIDRVESDQNLVDFDMEKFLSENHKCFEQK